VSFPPYAEYKDSGVAWLGAVPGHWEVMRFKNSIADCRNGIWGDEAIGDENDIICIRVADFHRDAGLVDISDPTFRNVREQDRQSRLVVDGDLLLEKSGGGEKQLVGAVVRYTHPDPAICSNFVARMRLAEGMSSSFWTYAHAAAYAVRLNYQSIKQTSGIQNLDQTQYFDELAAFPPLAEQEAIAGFLDREVGKIDSLVTEQERLIALLKEKRQAVISHAVTKGLNPTAPLKDSGIEWLGQIPAHWEVVRLGNLYQEAVRTGSDELPILSVSIHRGVSDYEIPDEDMERNVARSEDRSKYKRVQPNDLVYNMMRAWQGGFGTVQTHGQVSPAYVVAQPTRTLRSEYIEALLRTPCAVEEMRRHSRGVTDFRLRLYWDEFKDIKVALPPSDEIDAILAAGAAIVEQFTALEATSQSAITLLAERRAALISAAVTGKIDVRTVATQSAEMETA